MFFNSIHIHDILSAPFADGLACAEKGALHQGSWKREYLLGKDEKENAKAYEVECSVVDLAGYDLCGLYWRISRGRRR